MSVAVVLTYDATNARVVINATGLLDASVALVERSTNQVTWTTVRGGTAVTVSGSGVLTQLYDYEFAPGVPNYYRVTPDVLRLLHDSATRTVANGFGTADTGQAYTVESTTSNYAATGTKLTITPSAGSSDRAGTANVGKGTWVRARAKVSLSALPTTATFELGLVLRETDASNRYIGKLRIATATGAATLVTNKRVAGTNTDMATLASGTLTTATDYQLQVELQGSVLSVMWWPAAGAQPAAYQLVTTDVTTPPASTGVIAGLLARNNSAAFVPVASFDEFFVWNLADAGTVASITPTIDAVWLKSVTRPFLNRMVTVVNGSAVTVTRPGRSSTNSIKGRSFPVGVSDVRGSRTTPLTLRTETAEDGQTMGYIVDSGDFLFVQVPYGIRTVTSGYFLVGDVTEAFHPLRVDRRTWTLPLTEVAAPGATIVAAESTWASVLAAYATWADVLADNPTWGDLLARRGQPSEVIVP